MIRCSAVALGALLLAHCHPVSSPAPHFKAINANPAVAVLPESPIPNTPQDPPTAPQQTQTNDGRILFEGVAFDSRSHRLTIVDQTRGPGSEFADARAAASSIKGLAATNGGFFTPEGDPLGLVITQGISRGSWNQASSLGAGVFYESYDGRMAITRRDSLGPKRASHMKELLQAGPLLIENTKTIDGLDASKSTSRTFLLWDGNNRWWLGRSAACSLNQLAQALQSHPPVGWKIQAALNLDGGSSTDLWFSSALNGKESQSGHWFRKPARNYLVLLPRNKP